MSDDPLSRFLAARIDEGRMPGAVWWVEGPGGEPRHQAAGSAVLDPRPSPATEDTPYDLASLTKPLVTATLLVLLEQDGLLDLETPAAVYVPELAGSPHERASLLALATHTAGLPAWRPLYAEGSTLEGYLGAIARCPPAADARPLYSDLGYIVLGAAIERAAGSELNRLFHERIATPLGLRRTGFAARTKDYSDAAATERGNTHERVMAGEAGVNHPFRDGLLRGEVHDANAYGLGGVAGHAGLFGTAAEVAGICREWLHPTAIGLGSKARERLLRPAPGRGGFTVGLSTARLSTAACGILPDLAPGHTGFTGTSLWLVPDAGRIFVLLTNRVHPQVSGRSFQPVRRAFHRLVSRGLHRG